MYNSQKKSLLMITMANDCYDDDDIVKKRKLSIVKEANSTKKGAKTKQNKDKVKI